MLPATITNVMPNPTVIVIALCCNSSFAFVKVGKRSGIRTTNVPSTTKRKERDRVLEPQSAKIGLPSIGRAFDRREFFYAGYVSGLPYVV